MSEPLERSGDYLVEDDELDALRLEVESDPQARAVYFDTLNRVALLSAGRALRKKQNQTQKCVAKAMGTTQSAVSDIESGRIDPQIRTLQRYARALDHRIFFDFLPSDDSNQTGVEDGGETFKELKERALSPLLTALMTDPDDQARTVAGLKSAVPLPESMLRDVLNKLQMTGWATSAQHNGEQVYSLNEDQTYVIGIALRRSEVVGVLMNLHWEVIKEWRTKLSDCHPETVVNSTVDLINQLLANFTHDRVLGVGVSIAGVVTSEGTVEFAPDLQSGVDIPWHGVRLEAMIEAALLDRLSIELRVVVENDANALAVREYLRRADQSVAVVLLSGVGIGAGLVFNGNLAPGGHFAAGEGGHMIIDPSGPECRAGLPHNGCLETMASAEGILNSLDITVDENTDISAGLAIANNRIQNGDQLATEAFRKAGAALGRFLSSIVLLIDPARVVFYAHKEFVSKNEFAAAKAFQVGVQTGLDEARLCRVHGSTDPRLEWHPWERSIAAQAAGAAAVRLFLALPSRWAPSLGRAAMSHTVNAG